MVDACGAEEGAVFILLDDGAGGADSAASLLEQPPIVPSRSLDSMIGKNNGSNEDLLFAVGRSGMSDVM